MATIEKQAPHLKPVLVKYGKATPKVGAPGGWELHVTARGTVSGVLNSSAAAYDALAKSSILPRPKPLPSPKPTPVAIPKGPRVMIGVATSIDSAMDRLTTGIAIRSARDEREADEEDLEAAGQIAAAAQAAAVRAATRVKTKTLTKTKTIGRMVVHGYSRRHGKIVRDFKRRSPTKRMRFGGG